MGLGFEAIKNIMAIKKMIAPGERAPRLATLGYQDLILSAAELRSLFDDRTLGQIRVRRDKFAVGQYGLAEPSGDFGLRTISFDQAMEALKKPPYSDRLCLETFSVFSAMGFHCQSLDLVPHYGVETVVNLNHPLSEALHGLYDVVIDGGTIEHCFHVSQALLNIAAMLKNGGVVRHGTPWSCRAHGFYNIDPLLYREFYQANGFKLIDCFYYQNGQKKSLPGQGWNNYVPETDQAFCFMAQKTGSSDFIREPIQEMYDFYHRYPEVFTYGPLLASRETKTEQPRPDETLRLTETGSVYDAIIRNLQYVCQPEELAAVKAERRYLDDPYELQDLFHQHLLQAADDNLARKAADLAGQTVFFLIDDQDTYERWRHLFNETSVAALLINDDNITGLKLQSPEGWPVTGLKTALASRPQLPVVIFSDRRSVSGTCRTVCHLHPRGLEANLVPCWR